MKCSNCGSEQLERTEGEHRLLGLESVRLVGVPMLVCRHCGEIAQKRVPDMRELQKVVTNALVRKRGRLTAAEFRWLRKRLRLKGAELARLMGVTPPTVSRWETGATPISSFGDRLLRTIVAQQGAALLFDLQDLADIVDDETEPLSLTLEHTPIGWYPAREVRASA
ncbi:MAG: type II TA system antitoxin MqsA family protein [Myxococcota bacterium]